MPTCFVIQPFDDGKQYDKRYADVFEPAIRDAGLKPYRVDQDPSVSVPIEEIERGIQASDVCLVEITTNNPNVWFELGYAIASKREVVLVCSAERDSRFPFDVQHRTIIRYSSEAPSDFEELRTKITARLKAELNKREQLGQVGSVTTTLRVEGLEPHEIAGLIAVAQEVDDSSYGISAFIFRRNMEHAGFTRLASTLALNSLTESEMLERIQEDYEGDVPTFKVTSKGMAWLRENKDRLRLQIIDEESQEASDDDLPF